MPPACLPAVNAWGADVGGGDPWQDTTGLAASFRGIAETLQKAGSSHLFVTAAGNQARQLRHQWDDSDPQGDFWERDSEKIQAAVVVFYIFRIRGLRGMNLFFCPVQRSSTKGLKKST